MPILRLEIREIKGFREVFLIVIGEDQTEEGVKAGVMEEDGTTNQVVKSVAKLDI